MTCSLILDNANILIGDGSSLRGHVVVNDGLITAVEPGLSRNEHAIDLDGMWLTPGLIDLMLLGGFNLSVARDNPTEIAKRYAAMGVTSCQFCTGALPDQTMRRVADNLRQAKSMSEDSHSPGRILGWYLEGPYQQPSLSGASLREHTAAPLPDHVAQLLESLGDVVSMVNVSPGLASDVAAITLLRDAGKIVTMAHADTDADHVLACVDAGTSVLGHVWNNNAGRIGDSGVQQPTLEHIALCDDRVRFIHLIADAVHVHPIMVQIILRCRGIESLCLVSDGNIRSGCEDGVFEWDDGQQIRKAGGVCRTKNGWLAGSALLLPDMVRTFMGMTGLPLSNVIQTVTRNPADCMGVGDRLGQVKTGYHADLVAWDRHCQVRRVWSGGQEISQVNDYAEVRL